MNKLVESPTPTTQLAFSLAFTSLVVAVAVTESDTVRSNDISFSLVA